jgi:hypothetical protein
MTLKPGKTFPAEHPFSRALNALTDLNERHESLRAAVEKLAEDVGHGGMLMTEIEHRLREILEAKP